jgi:2-polyprenyl-3-methyl-5-hydroxy-6-metoxy-1,4-benzoquinol methylase
MLTTKDILQWDVRSWSKALTHWEKKIGKNNQTQCGIELGARQGGLSLWMAANGMQVICSDLERAEETAKPFHQQFTFSGSITYADIDATRLPYENYFDVVIFKVLPVV